MTDQRSTLLTVLAAATNGRREGSMASGLLLEGRRVGTWRCWRPDGTLLIRAGYRAGRRHGPWTRWYRSGVLALRVPYEAGVAAGPLEAWYAGGEPALSVGMEGGRLHGRLRLWHRSGEIWATGEFVDGVLSSPLHTTRDRPPTPLRLVRRGESEERALRL